MLQFGEVLCLAIGIIAVVYVVVNGRRIRALPSASRLIGPFLLFMIAWICTVVEGLFIQGDQVPIFVIGAASIGQSSGSPATEVFNLIEHTAFACAAVWLLVLSIRTLRRRPEGSP
jgi:hypothetical protein